MTIVDWALSKIENLRAKNIFGLHDDGVESNMANGGFSGYHPNTTRNRVARDTQRQQQVNEAPQAEGGAGWDPYTGAVPPQGTGYQQPYQQETGWQQPYQQETAYQQPYQQETGWQQPYQQETAYQQPYQQETGWQQPYQQETAYQQPYQQTYQMNNAWQGQQSFGMGGGYGQGTAAYQQNMEPQQSQQPEQSNISYMPGNFVGEDGTAFAHLERIAMLSNVGSCYRIIEFMRNGESVIVNTEQVTDQAECQRCLDLLYGACFAMKCSFTRIASRSIYLLAPATVMVKPYDTIRRMSDQDVNARWPENDRPRWDRNVQQERRPRTQHSAWSTPRQDDYMSFGGYGNAAGFGR